MSDEAAQKLDAQLLEHWKRLRQRCLDIVEFCDANIRDSELRKENAEAYDDPIKELNSLVQQADRINVEGSGG